jgi:nucleotide-binding universal stress UspA family protein
MGKGANRALERLLNSPLFVGLPVHVVMADTDNAAHREALDQAAGELRDGREVRATLQEGKPETVIVDVVAQTPGAMLMMGAYGHSPFRKLIIGSTTTAMIRAVGVPVLLVR